MYYTLAKEEPGHASLMRIYLRLGSEGADLPSIPPGRAQNLSVPAQTLPLPLWAAGSGVAELQDDPGMGTRMGPAQAGTHQAL